MPKVVDHEERRRQIAGSVCEIAATRGLADVSFREVASHAGVSVSLVQHYFGDKANLLKTSLDIQSETMDARIAVRISELGADPGPGAVLRAVALAFLPLDEVSRRSMLLYHGFAASALTDPGLRGAEMFTNGRALVQFFAAQLALLGEGAEGERHADDEADATGLVSLLLGLSLSVLLDQVTPTDAIDVVDRHLERLG